MLPNRLTSIRNQQDLMLTSVTALPDGSLLASAVNGGIYCISPDGEWLRNDDGDLAEGTLVNRLESEDGTVYACTNTGLYVLAEGRWSPTSIRVPCHRLRGKGGVLYAAADNGLWVKLHDTWTRTDYADDAVYDVFHTPRTIFLAQKGGLTAYDRYMQTSDDYPLPAPVSSLTVFHGTLLGACANGAVMFGDKKGNFDLVRYGNISVFSIAAAEGRVYACTNKGLYRFLNWNGKSHLCSVKLGCPVTDLTYDGEKLALSTYFQGIQFIPLQQGSRS